MTTPVGLPAVDTLDTYGGPFVDEAPVRDATTDQSADQANLIAMNVAGMTGTCVRAWRAFLGHATTPGDPADADDIHGAVWPIDTPDMKPAVTKGGTGIYNIQWPATVTDALGVQHTLKIRQCERPNVEGTTLYHANATVTGANTIQVRVYSTANTLNDAAGATIVVAWW